MLPSGQHYAPRERRRSSLDRRRTRSRQGSVTSIESAGSYLLEENNYEVYSGAASEIIPSSISSLHYPHHFGRGILESKASAEISPLLSVDENNIDLNSVKSNLSSTSYDTQVNFRFFSPDEIEAAPGGSTIGEHSDAVDYNTDWDYNVGKYEEAADEFAIQDNESSRNFSAHLESSDYGSTSSQFARRNRRQSESSQKSDSQGSITLPEIESAYSSSTTKYQRYYLAEEDLVIGIAGYSTCIAKMLVYYFICISTFGLGYLILRWLPKYRVNLMGNKTALGKADWCVIENEFGELVIVPIRKLKFNERLSSFLRVHQDGVEEMSEKDPIIDVLHSFTYRYIKFFYNPLEDIFKTNSNWCDPRWMNVRNTRDGVSQLLHEQRSEIFNKNSIEIEEKSVFTLLIDEVLHPFYVFQVFSIFLWLADDYYYYASCIFLISIFSIFNTLIETKSTLKRLQQISKFSCDVRVWRNGFWKQIISTDLVPGDVFEVDSSLSIIPCDALLLNGEAIVNESMLTGESVPVSKSPATSETVSFLTENFTAPILAKSMLYNGTKLLKMKSSNDEVVTAMVLKVGFNTTKGSLIRSMLFPKPTGFKFYQDSFKYIAFMSMIAVIGFVFSTYNFVKMGISKKVMILRALDIITIVVPPALPATLTIGTSFAINRLKALKIYCIAPTRVNIGGKIDAFCFDKTGTLTEDGLDVLGIHSAQNAAGRKEIIFKDRYASAEKLDLSQEINEHSFNTDKYLLGCMSCCHSLRLIDSEVLGDPLDLKMFDFTGFNLYEDQNITVESRDALYKYEIRREYEFMSTLRRMSVIVKDDVGSYLVFTKGAPEIMYEICIKESLPANFDDLLYEYTRNGYRVIATAYKSYDGKNDSREFVERDLIFSGFIVFENKLKESSKPTLNQLNNANIRTVMCTGDNVLTAISVARECELIERDITNIYVPTFDEGANETNLVWEDFNSPEMKLDSISLTPQDIRQVGKYKLAITGDVFRYLLTEVKNHDIIESVLMKCDIFARMSPDEKNELVRQLQKLDYTVGFCGDGANDCGALKAADVGISLSEAEASVAAPFTSGFFEISCVLDVIREGRSSLVTSFSCFRYMSLYSAIQFITVSILYKRGTNLGDFQFLYIDLFLILPLAIFMSWSKPARAIVTKRPTANLVSPKILIPLVCHIFVLLVFQILLWELVQREKWYIKPIPAGDDDVKSSDNTVLFLFSNFQYILIAIVLTAGPPYREPVSNNTPFLINVCVAVLLSLTQFKISSGSKLGNLMQLTNLSPKFYCYIVFASLMNLILMLIGEKTWFIKISQIFKRMVRGTKSRISKKRFKVLNREYDQIGSV